MPHSSRQHSDYASKEKIEKHARSRSQSRSRMVIERTEVKSSNDPRGGYMQVEVHEISMAKETHVDDSYLPIYRAPITVQCLPTHGSTLAHAEYVENIEEWESMGRQTRSRTNEGLTGRAVEREERRARSKSGTLREYISDYDKSVSGRSSEEKYERKFESEYRSDSSFDSGKARSGGSPDQPYRWVTFVSELFSLLANL
ncbi:unnamed protein product [Enterobius vermicularis]|uniref:DUF4005 domain-containing protein n=1 Tax=Enterobius vermicularis TaxID=51028 RepID=A0A0N4UVJ0_ENTVE|nr:unnamed protein product [Enterobius vermicularis]